MSVELRLLLYVRISLVSLGGRTRREVNHNPRGTDLYVMGEAETIFFFYIDEFRKPNIPCYAYVAVHTGVSVNIWCVGNKSFWRDCKLNLCLGGGTPFCSDT